MKRKRETTKGCSNSIVRKNNKFRKRVGLNNYNICMSQMGRDQMSVGVSVPCRHATSIADAKRKPIFNIVKFSQNLNQGKGHELVVSNQGEELNSVRSQIRRKVVNWLCNV